jgi:hypothetical protein
VRHLLLNTIPHYAKNEIHNRVYRVIVLFYAIAKQLPQ